MTATPLAILPRQQAEEALRVIGCARANRASRAEGDRYLGSVADSGATPEAAVALAAREATGQRLKDESALAAQKVALQAVAAGIPGPAGMAIARVTLSILEAVAHKSDAAAIASSALGSIQGSGLRVAEALLADTVKVAGDNCLDKTAAIEVYRDGLKMLANPVIEPLEARLAHFGALARSRGGSGDSRAVGQIVLHQIERHTADAKIRQMAHDGFESSILNSRGFPDPSGERRVAEMQRKVFDDIASAAPEMDAKTKQDIMDELQRMASAVNQPVVEGGRIEIQEDTVVIGGVRVNKKKT